MHTAVDTGKKATIIEFYKGILPDNGKHRIDFCIEYHDTDRTNRKIDRVTYVVYNDNGELDFSGFCENDELHDGDFYEILKGYADMAGASLKVKIYAKKLASKTEEASDDMKDAIKAFSERYAAFCSLLKQMSEKMLSKLTPDDDGDGDSESMYNTLDILVQSKKLLAHFGR